MALKTTSSLPTSDGTSTAVYSRIIHVEFNKDIDIALRFQHYKNKTAATDKKEPIASSKLKEIYRFPIVTDSWRVKENDDGIYNFTAAELKTGDLFAVFYGKVKALLESEQNTVIDA